MVYRSKGAFTFKLRVSIPTRPKARTFSTGTTVKVVANDVERMVKRFIARREWAPLELVFDGLATLGEVYDAEQAGGVLTLVRERRDADLDPLVTEWAKRTPLRYVTQVRTFIPEGTRFPAGRFRRSEISAYLAGLALSGPTRNRYRAALSVFGKWLVEREVLEYNPVRDVAGFKEHEPRMTWMTWKDAERVAKASWPPFENLFAIMAATGMELGASLALTRDDIDTSAQTIHARGSKTPWRNRVVRYEDWARAFVFRATQDLVGPAPLFPGIKADYTLKVFKAAQKAVGLSGHRLHDLRHTYAVNALKKGYRPQVVAHQLGHRDATMVTKVYGRYLPSAADYQVPATVQATSASRTAGGKRGK